MEKNRALFLDRDGVINIDKGYVYRVDDFIFTDKIFHITEYFQNRGYLIFVITNQSGIARNYYSEQDFAILTEWMVDEFSKRKIKINKVYHCPHHPEFNSACSCRKPEPGMILKAAEEFNIDLSQSVLIGDNDTDLEAGKNAGVGKNYLINELNISF